MEIAKAIGNEKDVRAVAQAIGANGIDIFIPCHRVVGAKHSLTGFAGGLDKKKVPAESWKQGSLEKIVYGGKEEIKEKRHDQVVPYQLG